VTMSLSVLGGSVEEVFAKVSTEVLSTVPGAGVQIVTPDPV